MPKRGGANTITHVISKQAGRKHIKIAGRPTLLSCWRSKFSPALVKMMIKAIWRSSVEIFKIDWSKRFRP